MGFSRRFGLRLASWLALLVVALAAAAALIAWGRAPTALLLALVAVGLAVAGVWRLVYRGNVELARFVMALERTDLGQSFRSGDRGAGFDELGGAYERALDRLRAERRSGAGAARFAETLVDGAPTPLLVLGPGEEVRFVNKAARRLFGRERAGSLATLARFGPAFVAALRAAAPGPTRLGHLIVDGLTQRVALDTSSLDLGEAGGRRRVVAVKVVQAELDEAELAAQVDLVRVLTHEVMNSLTPVTSLAVTARDLVGRIEADTPALADARLATEALARRAGELERFVTSYKGFSDAPAPQRASIEPGSWLEQLARLFAATPAARGVAATWSVAPGTPAIHGDPALLTQVMLNLVKNGAEAAGGSEAPTVVVAAAPAADDRVRLTVADSGPGIPEHLARDVFLPFFTTKRDGTGIGLSLARQIVLLHGGQIGIAADRASCLEILLPAVDGR